VSIAVVIRRHPLGSYFAIVYAASLIALLAIGLPSLRDAPRSWTLTPLLAFPVMVISVGLAGLGLTRLVDGKAAARALMRSTRRAALPRRYYAALLIPPAAILAALLALQLLASHAFRPNLFPLGLLFGLVAGFCEEFGWSGFAYPRLRARLGAHPAALLLGLLWGLWHLPVVDSLGVAHPHGRAWPLFFLSFLLALTALRLLISWLYTATGSLQLAQLMHASSTGFLVVFGAAHVSPAQEAAWYALYGGILAVVAVAVVALSRRTAAVLPQPATSARRSSSTAPTSSAWRARGGRGVEAGRTAHDL
jgi:membrane protease YdiL (CAAX protease family)